MFQFIPSYVPRFALLLSCTLFTLQITSTSKVSFVSFFLALSYFHLLYYLLTFFINVNTLQVKCESVLFEIWKFDIKLNASNTVVVAKRDFNMLFLLIIFVLPNFSSCGTECWWYMLQCGFVLITMKISTFHGNLLHNAIHLLIPVRLHLKW